MRLLDFCLLGVEKLRNKMVSKEIANPRNQHVVDQFSSLKHSINMYLTYFSIGSKAHQFDEQELRRNISLFKISARKTLRFLITLNVRQKSPEISSFHSQLKELFAYYGSLISSGTKRYMVRDVQEKGEEIKLSVDQTLEYLETELGVRANQIPQEFGLTGKIDSKKRSGLWGRLTAALGL